MSEAKRIGPEKARDLLESGEAKLVCAYEDVEKCEKLKLPWAIPFSEFEIEAQKVSQDENIVFY